MRLNSAREAWHQAYYQPWDSVMTHVLEMAQLEASVQKTEKQRGAGHAAHQALAAHIQYAIDRKLPGYVRAFGHWMYSPLANDDHRETAEAAVMLFAYDRHGRMTAKKAERARYVAAGVLYRYRRMHQGGQSSMPDPLAAPEAFRGWLLGEYGIKLSSEQWGREWGGFVQHCFDVCNDIDKQALGPVAAIIAEMKEAA
ncbi:hypothetical protein D9M68_202460 [compost metagenome]